MNADSAFLIGATHEVCQDYAVAGHGTPDERAVVSDWQTNPYVILSDGCSSSPDTDIGARLLVKAAEQGLLNARAPTAHALTESHQEAAHRALWWAELAGLRPQAVDATLLTAHLSGDELIAGCSGDGVVVFQSRTGVIDAYSISYASGYPLYPAYAHQPGRQLALEDKTRGCDKEVKHYRGVPADGPLRLVESRTSSSLTEVFTVPAQDSSYAALFSDGIHSFYSTCQTETSKRVEAISMEAALRELIAFRHVRGAFVRRRLKRFVKDCQTKGWQHMDDLAFGALHMGD